ncbi:MAG TPA: hypothetical protein VNK23_07955 [Candidatus Dormibacteraeota bacterium]|nr:hypothetical protein [Candidatus Dormibacteraeota bacterium]
MDHSFMKVLLMGENPSGSSYLRWQLENRGCHCWFAHSTKEAATLYQEHTFDLILSTQPLSRFDAVLPLLGTSSCNIFHCRPDEDSCWWLPIAPEGQKSTGEAGMRPSEFLEMLDKLLAQRRTMNIPAQRPIMPPQVQERAFKAAS